MIHYQVKALDAAQIAWMDALNEDELKERGVVKQVVDANPGYPCRVTLEDAEVSETVYLFSHPIHDVESPYKLV